MGQNLENLTINNLKILPSNARDKQIHDFLHNFQTSCYAPFRKCKMSEACAQFDTPVVLEP